MDNKPLLFFLLFITVLGNLHIAQAQQYSLYGKVSTLEEPAIAGANIWIKELKTGLASNADGSYVFEKLPAQKFHIIVSHIGFQTVEKTITLSVDTELNWTLEPSGDQLAEILVEGIRSPRDEIKRLPDLHDSYIISGRKNEVVDMATANANIAEKTARQIFAKVPGIFVYDMDGSGNQINIASRGLDPHRSWDYNVRHNGIMTNSDIYGYPASHFSAPMESIQRIELVRGTASLQYGAMFGGMVNYVTKGPDTSQRLGFEHISTLGSYGLFSTYNALGGKSGKWEYYGYYHYRKSDGYRDNSGSQANSQYAMVSYKPAANISFRAELARSTYLYQLPGQLNDSMFYANPRQATRSRNYYSPDIYVPSLRWDWQVSPRTRLSWISSAVLGSRNSVQIVALATTPDVINPSTGTYKNRQVDIDLFNSYSSEFRLAHQYHIGKWSSTLVSGVRWINNRLWRRQLGKGTTGSDYDLSLTDPVWGRDLTYRTQNMAFFAENLIKINEAFSVSPGIRWEAGITRMRGQISYLSPEKLPTDIKHQFPLLGVSAQYKFNPENRLYGGWSQAYRPVIFADVIPPTALDVTDPYLADASGYNAELGYSGKWLKGAINMDASLFVLRINDRIGSLIQSNAAGETYVYKTNVGSSITRGAEFYLDCKPLGLFGSATPAVNFSLFTSTAFMDGYYLKGIVIVNNENVDITGNTLETTPRWISRNGLQVWGERFAATLQYSYVSESFAEATNAVTPNATGTKGLVPAYGLWDINATLRFAKIYSLRAGINNITNESYFTKRPSGYPGPGIWPSDGRSFTISLGVKW